MSVTVVLLLTEPLGVLHESVKMVVEFIVALCEPLSPVQTGDPLMLEETLQEPDVTLLADQEIVLLLPACTCVGAALMDRAG